MSIKRERKHKINEIYFFDYLVILTTGSLLPVDKTSDLRFDVWFEATHWVFGLISSPFCLPIADFCFESVVSRHNCPMRSCSCSCSIASCDQPSLSPRVLGSRIRSAWSTCCIVFATRATCAIWWNNLSGFEALVL